MSKTIRILIALACSMLVASAIFFFSDQNGTESHAESGAVAKYVAKLLTASSADRITEKELMTVEKVLDMPVRKFAHLFIYFCLGLVLYVSCVFAQGGKRNPVFILICLGVVIAVAVADELNQYFQVGRGSSITDVLIDTIGGALGIYFYYIVTDFFGHVKGLLGKKK